MGEMRHTDSTQYASAVGLLVWVGTVLYTESGSHRSREVGKVNWEKPLTLKQTSGAAYRCVPVQSLRSVRYTHEKK